MIGTMLIAGASRGIGLAVAEHFESRCADLYGVSRSRSSHGTWIEADLATDAGIAQVARQFDGRSLDVLIHSAGTWETDAFTRGYSFRDGPEADIDRVLAANLMAPIKLVRQLLPSLERASNARVVWIGALTGLDNAASREVANSASKYGLRGAAHALRRELPRLALTVVNPGNVATAEVLDDIAAGRFPPQAAIPLEDLMQVIECALSLSPRAVATEIDLVQIESG